MAITAAQRLITVVLASLVLVPLGGAADTRGQVFPGKAGRLVFQSNRDGSYDLYVAATDGSNQRKLLAKPDTDEFNPGWSPTGTRLVFQTGPQDASNFDIWTINSSGKGARPVVTGATNDRAPQWCDQSTIVFSRRISATSSDVWRVEANGKVLRRLTSYPGIESSPTCRPNTDRLAFISDRDGQPRIYELRLNGAGLRPLTDAPSLDPDYAPDGSTIAYVAPDTDGNLEVFTKNLRSGQIVQRTHTSRPYEYRLPKFAPNYRALMGSRHRLQTRSWPRNATPIPAARPSRRSRAVLVRRLRNRVVAASTNPSSRSRIAGAAHLTCRSTPRSSTRSSRARRG